MVHVIWIVGAFIAVAGVAILIVPGALRKWLNFFVNNRLIYIPIILRIVIGGLFLIFARETHFSWIIVLFGILITGAGIIFLVMPYQNINKFLKWWVDQPLWLYRAWAVVSVVLGGIIMYAGVPVNGG